MAWWKAEIIRTLHGWLGNPGNTALFAILLFLGLLAAVIVLRQAARAVRSPEPGWLRSIVVVAGGLLLTTATTVAARRYLQPHIGNESLQALLPYLVPTAACLILVLPLCCVMHRINPLQGLIALAMSLAAAVVVVLIVHGAIGAIERGGGNMRRTRQRSDELEEIM